MSGIRYAWCAELNEVVTAPQAKREFLAQSPRPDAFTFFCANEECRQSNQRRTRVTCVNYHLAPSEGAQSVVVHYRERDEHNSNCEYRDEEQVSKGAGGATRERSRNVGLKVADTFDVFDPADLPDSGGTKPPTTSEPFNGKASGGTGGSLGGAPKLPTATSTSSTRFVEDLATLHVEAKQDPTAAALLDRDISVPKRGVFRLRALFQRVESARLDGSERIWFGGARLKRYGRGFALTFIDKPEGLQLTSYVSPDDVADYRYRHQLEELLAEAVKCRYVTGYVWGTVEKDDDLDGKAKLQPARLQHLAIILGPQVDPKDSSRSSNSNK